MLFFVSFVKLFPVGDSAATRDCEQVQISFFFEFFGFLEGGLFEKRLFDVGLSPIYI
jgi:hypothetical protein